MQRFRDVIRFGSHSGLSALSARDRLAMAWVVVCGRALAGRGSVVGYEQGAVRIEVRETAWLEQMRSMSEHLTRELARVAGMKVTGLHFIVKR